MKRLLLGAAAFALVCAALFTGLARADVTAQMERGGVQLICTNAIDAFDQGVWARSLGIPKTIKQAPPGMPTIAASEDVPRDSLYHPDWDKLTERDKAFFQKHLFAGYDAADAMVSSFLEKLKDIQDNEGFSIDAVLSIKARQVMADGYFKECLRTETAARTYKKPASLINTKSEALGKPRLTKEHECSTWYDSAHWVMGKVRSGMTKEAFWFRYSMPESYDDAYRVRVSGMVDKAYANPSGAGDFAQEVYWSCMDDWKESAS